ncbi:MAG: ATP-binding cassette domain-containing protein [Myxococcaceae bacterium]
MTAVSNAETESGATPWERLKAVLAPERGDLWALVVYGLAVGLLSLVVPVAAQAIVNTAAFGTVLQPIVVLSVVVVCLLIVAGGIRALQVVVVERLQQRLFARMAIDLSHRLPRVEAETYDTYRGPELVNRFMDVMTVQKATGLMMLDGFALVLQAVIGLVLLAFYSPLLLGFDVILLVSMGFVLFVLGRGAVRTSVQESYRKYEVVGWLEEIARVPLAFWNESGLALALRRTDEATNAYLDARKAHFRVLFRQIVGTLVVQAVASGFIFGLGGLLVTRSQLTLGQLVAAELVVAPVVSNFAKFGKYLEALYDLLAGVDKIGHLFDLPLVKKAGDTSLGQSGPPVSMQLKDVSAGYAGTKGAPIRDATWTLARGSHVALLGPQGSGKSVLLDVMLGLRRPLSGAVMFDGLDARDVSMDALRTQVMLVRGVQLFDGTLLDNVRVGRSEVGLLEVKDALENVGLLEEVLRLPEGLQTRLSGGRAALSHRQALQLMIARALLAKPRLLALDETLDLLEPAVRELALNLLKAPNTPWTLVLATHLPELASKLESVMRIQDGTLVPLERR